MTYTLEDITLYSYFLRCCVCHIKPILDTGIRHSQYLIGGGGGGAFFRNQIFNMNAKKCLKISMQPPLGKKNL